MPGIEVPTAYRDVNGQRGNMTKGASRWDRFERSSDAYLAVVAMLLMVIVLPIMTSGIGSQASIFSAVLVGVAVTLSMAASQAHRWTLHVSWVASLLVVLSAMLSGLPTEVAVVGGVVLAVLLLSTPLVILRRISKHEQVTPTTMWGAIAAYLAFGLAFSLLYASIVQLDPGAFTNLTEARLGDTNYFSFVTMTTLGYGDIAPVADVARALVVFQTLIGQIYLVVVVARVVSLLGRSSPRMGQAERE